MTKFVFGLGHFLFSWQNHVMTKILSAFLFIPLISLTFCSKKLTDPSDIQPISVESQTSSSSVDPEKIYSEFCANCHGAQMEMFVDRKWVNGKSKESIYRSIEKGILSSGMPAYGSTMSKEEISALTDYILEGVDERKTYDIGSDDTPKYYKTEAYQLSVDTVVGDLEVPWGIKVTEEGKIYFTERKGTFKIFDPSTKEVTDIAGVPDVRDQGQGGMMDVAFHPDFENNGWIYLSYSKYITKGITKESTTAVVRGRVKEGKWVDQEEIFEAVPYLDSKYHYGSRLIFDNDGYLYLTVGDRGRRDKHPQFLTNSCGKVHRLYDDGRVPEDNPFVNEENAIKSIWSYGHRNAQGMIYDADKNEIWEHEHGPRGGDELNLIQKSVNYGWPIISYGINYNGTVFTEETHKSGMKQPYKVWIPSIGPSGMALVNNSKYPEWNGSILTGALRFNYISRILVEDGKVIEDERILQDIGRVRSIEMGGDGYIYVGVENPGRILRVELVE